MNTDKYMKEEEIVNNVSSGHIAGTGANETDIVVNGLKKPGLLKRLRKVLEIGNGSDASRRDRQRTDNSC